ncbi:TonB-dependent receptor [Novosphingobium kaempferiae]|uniref:TonB-dependent receptor n=1 Tax=Novosphingobium kaempferiae TaxID=2896849 RepID=UPI001E4F01E1|nr:TonB-dependent receptor [Novosphingobium kaempferiae]
MKRFALLAGSAAVVVAIAQVPVAHAQEVDSTPPQSEAHASVDEIVVTATRRATNLQSTPVAVSAIGENVIAQTAARNIGDLAAFVPNFSAAKIAGFNAASFSIRGASQTNISMYSEPPITVLVDDFVIAHVQTQLLDTFDLAGMEVLRGPQGTLFGKNTTGGAIVVRTKRPELDILGVQGMVRVGSFGTRQIKGAVNIPIVEDMLALRVVGSYEKSDGYMRRGGCYGPITPLVADSKWAGAAGCGDGKRVGGDDIFDGRVKLLWKPGDRTEVLFQYQALRDRSDAAAGVNGTPANNPRFLLSRLNIVEGTGDPLKNAGGSFRSGYLLDQDDGTSVNVDMYQIHVDQEVDFGQFSANIGRRDELAHLPQSYVFSNVPTIDGETLSLYDGDRAFKRRTQQAELRFASDFGGPFDFVAGVFHQRDRVYRCGHQLLGFLDLSSRPGPFGPNNLNPQLLCNAQKARSTAGYVEGNYKLTDRLTLTAGVRYTTETKRWWGRPTVYVQQLVSPADPNFTWQDLDRALDGNVFDYPAGVVSSKTTWREPTWRGTASYQATDDIFAYFTYSRGFKSGLYADSTGISGAAIVPSQLIPTNPEKADSFELGVKTELLDKRLRFNLAAFHVTYNDAQRQVNVPVVRVDGSQIQETRYFNAAKAVVKGLEAEITAVPVEGITLRSAIGYQDAKYKSFVSPLPTGRNLAEAPLERTPRWQASLDGTYETEIGNWGKVSVNGNVQYAGRNLYNLSLTSALDDAYLPARTLFNASITFSDPEDKYYIRLIGQNLSDKRYLVGHLVAGGLFVTKNYGPPRFLAAEIGFKM